MGSIVNKIFNSSPKSRRLFAEGLGRMAIEKVHNYRIVIEQYADEIGLYDNNPSVETTELYVTVRDFILRYYKVSLEHYYEGINVPLKYPESDSYTRDRGQSLFKDTDFYKNGGYDSINTKLYNPAEKAISDFLNQKLDEVRNGK